MTGFTPDPGPFVLKGAFYTKKGVRFCHVLKTKHTELVLSDGKGHELLRSDVSSWPGAGAVRTQTFAFRRKDLTYRYESDGRVLPDPFVLSAKGEDAQPLSLPDEAAEHVFPDQDSVFLKLHVRGYTMLDPDVPEGSKGTYRGLRSVLPRVSETGIDAVVVMPCYTFDRSLPNGKRNYWGYGSRNLYLRPAAYYAESPDACAEFRDLIRSAHASSISFLMEIFVPFDADLSVLRQALWIYYFVYGADGFYLSGDPSAVCSILRDPYLADAVLITDEDLYDVLAEEPCRNAGKKYLIHRSFRKNARAFLAGTPCAPSLAAYTARQPGTLHFLNGITDQNGFTLYDLVSYNKKHNELNGEGNLDGPDEISRNFGAEGPTDDEEILSVRLRHCKNAFAVMLLSAGCPILYAGDAYLNSQGGNNNAYALDTPDGWTEKKDTEETRDLRHFLRELIRIRRNCGIGNASFREPYGRLPYRPDEDKAAFALYTEGSKRVFLAVNETEEPYTFALPDGVFQAVLSSGTIGTGKPEKETTIVPPMTAVCYIGE